MEEVKGEIDTRYIVHEQAHCMAHYKKEEEREATTIHENHFY